MKVMHIFANAIVRRVAYVVVAMVLAWLGLSDARAADQGEALHECNTNAAAWIAAAPTNRRNARCVLMGTRYDLLGETFIGGLGWSDSTVGSYYFTNSCGTRPPIIGAPPTSTQSGVVRQGSISCVTGCAATWLNNGDGTWTGTYSGASVACTNETLKEDCPLLGGRYWNAFLQACEPQLSECTANEVKDAETGECVDACPAGMKVNQDGQCEEEAEECPAGSVKSPEGSCLPGEGQCAAGEARRPDGTCGKDSDGDGVADEDDDDPSNDPDKETASGGDSCNAPPSCSGGPIDCLQVKIQWRIDCNTRKNVNVSGGSCAAMPICTGESCNALEYSQLLMQWRTACALEKEGQGGPGGGDSGAMDPVSSGGVLGDDGYTGADGTTVNDGEIEFDEGGFGYGSTCPEIPSVTINGHTIDFNTSVFCNWMQLGGMFVMIMAYLGGLAIVMRA